jgi:hypothetical protein
MKPMINVAGNPIQVHTCGRKSIKTIHKRNTDDLFIAFASYETRCKAVAETFAPEYRCKNTLVFYNREFVSRGATEKNLDALFSITKKFAFSSKAVEISLSFPSNIVSSLHEQIFNSEIELEGKAVTIDISTFPRLELLLLLRYLKMLNTGEKIRILYTKPKKYGQWLSKGFKEVVTVPSFAGTQIPGRKKLLIILAGFEEERMIRLWEEHEPSKTILVMGDPPTSASFLEINKLRSHMIRNRENVHEERAAANDPFSARDALENLLQNHKRDYNIFISPMNTKIQTVGLFLLAQRYSWFQITLAVPNDYNVTGYSSGAEEIFEFYI